MANLYGRLINEKGKQSTRCASKALTAKAETWQAIVTVELWKDGRCE